jgi:hypothetical protein
MTGAERMAPRVLREQGGFCPFANDCHSGAPAALNRRFAARVAGPRNLLAAAAGLAAAARTGRAKRDTAGQRVLDAEGATGDPRVDFSVARKLWGCREFRVALPRNDSIVVREMIESFR